jgi:hypothetical protein
VHPWAVIAPLGLRLIKLGSDSRMYYFRTTGVPSSYHDVSSKIGRPKFMDVPKNNKDKLWPPNDDFILELLIKHGLIQPSDMEDARRASAATATGR